MYRAGTKLIAGVGVSTVCADFDFETYSEAGFVWSDAEQKWNSLPGLSNQNRGLGAVGVRNYVEHPSFKLLSLAWDLKDGKGVRWWRPELTLERPGKFYYPRYEDSPWAHPVELLEYIASGAPIEAHNVAFEWQVWNFHCVPVLGWPAWCVDDQGLPPL